MKNNLFLFVCLLFVSCSDTFESPKAERDGFIQLTETLSGYVKDCTNDLFAYAYSFNDNSFDEVIANDVIASNAPHFENEISSKFLTRSGYENSIQSSLTENQMRLLGEILQMSEKKDFTFACAFDLVKRSELSEEEAQAMYAFVAITSGIVDALQNANPMMTRAMSDGSRRIMCNMLSGTLVSIWASWGGAIAVGLGVCTAGAGAVAITVVSIVGSALMSAVMGC